MGVIPDLVGSRKAKRHIFTLDQRSRVWYVTGSVSSVRKEASPLFKVYSPVKVQIYLYNLLLNGC
jgi:hypothetical protein